MSILNLDPTRTVTLRRNFKRGITNVFRRLRRALQDLILREDTFGLRDIRKGTTTVLDGISSPTINKRWAYKTQEEAVNEFEKWVKGQLRKELMSESEALRWRRYIARGFEVGTNRALNDVKRGEGKGAKGIRFLDEARGAGFQEGTREIFLRTTLQSATSGEKLRLLQSSALSEVRGLVDDAVPKLRRALVDGLVRNQTPKEIASRLTKTLKISEGRSKTIANTELVRAHAEAQLIAMETLGVTDVGVAVEWSTTSSACPLCKPLDGIVLKIKEAKGMIPRHPNCKCAWVVANVGEDKTSQLRSKTEIQKAVKKSQREGSSNDDWEPGKTISKDRPKSVLNSSPRSREVTTSPHPTSCECDPTLLAFSKLMSELGLL